MSEKFGFLFETKYFCRAWGYRWGYTKAQIDLMVADQPLVVYPKTKKDGPKKHTKKEMDDLYDRWLEKKKKEGSLVGKKISMSDYLNNKVKQ